MSALSDFNLSHWNGKAELWLDPLGNDTSFSDCSLAIEKEVLCYTWVYEGAQCEGKIEIAAETAVFTDSWHQAEPMQCRVLQDAWGIFQIQGRYGPQLAWGWRIGLSLRTPTDELVLQMTNIAPWGEEARAVRMVFSRDD